MTMYYVGNIMRDPNYLEHHGILGMKWGVRRYQNEDGTLTAAGKARYVTRNNSTDQKVASIGNKAVRAAAAATIGTHVARAAGTALYDTGNSLLLKGKRLADWKKSGDYIDKAAKFLQAGNFLDKIGVVSLGVAIGSAAFVTGRYAARKIVAKSAERASNKVDSFENKHFYKQDDGSILATYDDLMKAQKLIDKKFKAADRAKRWGVG